MKELVSVLVALSVYLLIAVLWYSLTGLEPKPMDPVMFGMLAFGPSIWLSMAIITLWGRRK